MIKPMRPLVALLLLAAAPLACAAAAPHWVGTWSTSLYETGSAGGPQSEITLRQPVHVSIGGHRIRVRFSNRYGSVPLTIGAASVARSGEASAVAGATLQTLHFDGADSVRIPPGAYVYSDPVALDVPADSNLSVSLYLPAQNIGTVSWHNRAFQAIYEVRGNAVGAASFDAPLQRMSYYYLASVDVEAPKAVSAVVAFGDSITDGMHSSDNQNRRWPNLLAARLLAAKGQPLGVLNEGIAGNRMLNEGSGPAGLTRFDTDVLDQSGVSHVISLLAINDFGRYGRAHLPLDEVTVPEVERAYRQLVDRAHARGIRFIAGTIMPFEGAMYYSEQGETMRQQLNAWIRKTDLFDGVVDFDQAMRDPSAPKRIRPQFDSGDHLHPNDAGMAAMAAAIDLKLLRD
ncbi:SGNH/GDSL hydrolase family protein [Solimonas marina]|uniref:SGNH/GDSL hydrolase family protein n=1 Tax=Solimonas marina TaxID=2714601 RepID=A0A970BB71_9GAMM|nr:SGNH/GDSL hydrolase family protein [Solimonas marina]NKF24096.1 SGNH/GDSL hydrolase family protein [Solimonas marina]